MAVGLVYKENDFAFPQLKMGLISRPAFKDNKKGAPLHIKSTSLYVVSTLYGDQSNVLFPPFPGSRDIPDVVNRGPSHVVFLLAYTVVTLF